MFFSELIIVISVSIPNHSDFVNAMNCKLTSNHTENIESKNSTSTEYNYIKAKEFIDSNIEKYQDILP
jgi:hypothetical protein